MNYNNINKKQIRIFLLIWSIIFFFIGIYPLFFNLNIKIWSICISILFFVISSFKPELGKYFYIIWVTIGEYLGILISKFIMFILFFFLFTPISLVLKLLGKDLLNKKIEPNKATYWNHRKMKPQSMKKQF